jgi:hypothetical protein
VFPDVSFCFPMALLTNASGGDGCAMPFICLVPLTNASGGDLCTIPLINIPPLTNASGGDEGGMSLISISTLTNALSGDEPDMQLKNSCLSKSPWGKYLLISKSKTEYVKTYSAKPVTPNCKGSLHNQTNQHHLFSHIGGMAKRSGDESSEHGGDKRHKSTEPVRFLSLDDLNDSLPAAGEEAEHDYIHCEIITETHAGFMETQLTV